MEARRGEETAGFNLMVSSGNAELKADERTISEFQAISRLYAAYPDHFAQPLLLKEETDPPTLTLFSTRAYEKHFGLEYKLISGLSRKSDSPNFREFEQDLLLEEMVKVLTLAFDEEKKVAVAMDLRDFSLDYTSYTAFDLKLLRARKITGGIDPARYVFNIINYSLPSADSGHLVYLFDEKRVSNGLEKAFSLQGMDRIESLTKASNWLLACRTAYLAEMFKRAAPKSDLPVHRHNFRAGLISDPFALGKNADKKRF